jgi:hypothetical protein
MRSHHLGPACSLFDEIAENGCVRHLAASHRRTFSHIVSIFSTAGAGWDFELNMIERIHRS